MDGPARISAVTVGRLRRLITLTRVWTHHYDLAWRLAGRGLVTVDEFGTYRHPPAGLDFEADFRPEPATRIVVHPLDGSIITGHDDGSLRHWTSDGDRLPDLVGPGLLAPARPDRPGELVISPDGCWTALTGRDPSVSGRPGAPVVLIRWAADGHLGCRIATDGPEVGTRPAFSPDGALLAAGVGDEVVVWRVPDGAVAHRWPIPDEKVIDITFTAGGCLATVSLPYSRTPNGHSCSEHAVVRIWRPGEPGLTRQLGGADRIYASQLAYSPVHDLLAVGSLGGVRLYRVGDGGLVATLDAYGDLLAFSADGGLLAVGSPYDLSLWAVPDRVLRARGRTFGFTLATAACFSPDSTLLAVGGDDRTVHLWDIAARRPVRVMEAQWHKKSPIRRVMFGAGGRLVAAHTYDAAWIWWTDTGAQADWLIDGQTDMVSVAVHPALPIVAVLADDAIVRVRDLAAGTVLATIDSVEHYGDALEFSPDGTLLALPGPGYTIEVWSTSTWQPHLSVQAFSAGRGLIGPDQAVFSPDGTLLATLDRHRLAPRLWRVEDGAPATNLPLPTDAPTWCEFDDRSLAFSPDGTLLGRGHHLWRPADSALLDPPSDPEYRHGLIILGFAPDGQSLAALDYRDHRISLWGIHDRC